MRKTHRRDANHKPIVDALKKVGASVVDLSQVAGGVPDILVGFRSRLYLLELKNPDNAYGRKGLSDSQLRFAGGWNGNAVVVIRTVEDGLRAIGAIK